MLLMPHKKKIATLIVSGMKKPDFVQKMGEESKTGEYKLPEGEAEDDGKAVGLESAMEDFIAAVEAKDPKKMAEAFKHAFAMAEMSEEEPGDVEE